MTKAEFLTALKGGLSQLPEDEVQKTLEFYSDMIDDSMEDGLDEEEAVAALSSPEEAAEKILMDTSLPKLMKTMASGKEGGRGINIFLLCLGFPFLLVFFSLVLCLYIVIWCVLISLYAVVLSLAISGAASVIYAFFCFSRLSIVGLGFLGAGLLLCGLGVPAFFAVLFISKKTVWLTALIARRVKSLFIRRNKE